MTLYPTIAPRKTFTRASFLLQLSIPLDSFCIATEREGDTSPRADSEELPQAAALDGQPCFHYLHSELQKCISLD